MKILHVLFFILLSINAFGCVNQEYNVATGKEDIFFVSSEKEENMGAGIAKGIEANPEIKLDTDPLMLERVNNVGRRIAEVSQRKEVNYTFRVIDKDEVNAFALPGGYVFLFSGLVKKVDTDDELAGVIAHEIAHVVARHSIKRLQGSLGYDLLRIFMLVSGKGASPSGNIDYAFGQLIMSYSREDEALADKIAIQYLKEAGYDPMAMISFLKKLQQVNKEAPIRAYSVYRSHPHISDRIRMIKQELTGEVDFDDYLNKPVE